MLSTVGVLRFASRGSLPLAHAESPLRRGIKTLQVLPRALFGSTAPIETQTYEEKEIIMPEGTKIILSPLTPDSVQEALNFTVDYLRRDEPLNVALGEKYSPFLSAGYVAARAKGIVDTGMSFIATTKDGNLVGVVTSCTQKHEEKAVEKEREKYMADMGEVVARDYDSKLKAYLPTYGDVLKLFDELHSNVPLPLDSPTSRILRPLCAAVSPKFRGQGLMLAALGHMFEVAKQNGYRYTIAESTTDYNARGMERLGAKSVNFIEYENWRNDGKRVLATVSKKHHGISLYVLDLQSADFNPRAVPVNPPRPTWET